MEGVDLPKGSTKPGEFSTKPRYTEFNGEHYDYPEPEDMEKAVYNILDMYNNWFDLCTKADLEDFDDFYLFKTCAWLLFELLDLHPFADGNGRLCRILCRVLVKNSSQNNLSADCRPTVGRHITDTLPTVYQQVTDSWPTDTLQW